MGLDIVAFKGLIPTEADNEEARCFHPHSHFPQQAEGIEGYFVGDEEFSFSAGSYSGYNHWRNQLARMVGFKDAEEAWKIGAGPMIALINFADNEGVIGPKTCQGLLQEFQAWYATAMIQGDEWFIAQYENWMRAFAIGSHGAILFC